MKQTTTKLIYLFFILMISLNALSQQNYIYYTTTNSDGNDKTYTIQDVGKNNTIDIHLYKYDEYIYMRIYNITSLLKAYQNNNKYVETALLGYANASYTYNKKINKIEHDMDFFNITIVYQNTVYDVRIKAFNVSKLPQLNGIALPITLSHFVGEYKHGNNILKWETATEINNEYFILYKSNDNKNWERIKTIYGEGNSNEKIEYEYTDKNINSDFYYRLEQTDFNGTTTKLKTIFIKNPSCQDEIAKLYNIKGQYITDININQNDISVNDGVYLCKDVKLVVKNHKILNW